MTSLRLLARELGPTTLTQYLRYQLSLKTGGVRRETPSHTWESRPPAYWPGTPIQTGTFFPLDREARAIEGREATVREADEILSGVHRLFGGPPIVLGNIPDWGAVPLQGGQVPLDRHWTAYDTSGPTDFRLLWEPSRFRWAFVLGRAAMLTGDLRYHQGFFELFDSWRTANPPNTGPHWISAQEAALRIMALSFAWYSLQDEAAGRAEDLLSTIAAHAERIPPTLNYARAQRNNHLISEAVGLYTVGVLFPFLRHASKWKAIGRRTLQAALADQVFGDGGYIQHSANYARFALSAGLWAARLAEINGEPLDRPSREALGRMTEHLAALVDRENGRIPRFGADDGSDVLPLHSGVHDDYRPVLQAGARQFLGRDEYPPGPWDELSQWMGIDPRAQKPYQPPADFPDAGIYAAPGLQARAFLRAARFTSRPGHSDQMHVDLWWRGHNVALDPGSYRYTAEPPWDNALTAAAAHNTVVIDDEEPMQRAGRFLWLDRHDAGCWRSEDGKTLTAEIIVQGVRRRRTVVEADDSLWIVVDELHGAGEHTARLAWHLPDWPYELNGAELTVDGPPGSVRVRIEPESVEIGLARAGRWVDAHDSRAPATLLGWFAPTYGYREPALTLVARASGALPLRLASWWQLGALDPERPPFRAHLLDADPLSEFFAE